MDSISYFTWKQVHLRPISSPRQSLAPAVKYWVIRGVDIDTLAYLCVKRCRMVPDKNCMKMPSKNTIRRSGISLRDRSWRWRCSRLIKRLSQRWHSNFFATPALAVIVIIAPSAAQDSHQYGQICRSKFRAAHRWTRGSYWAAIQCQWNNDLDFAVVDVYEWCGREEINRRGIWQIWPDHKLP